MKYYYFNPFNRQYYFPEGFKQQPLFASFYHPYTFAGSLLWFVWKNMKIVRQLCREDSIDTVLPIKRFKKYLPYSAIFAINKGTIGVEQKISIIAYDSISGEEFFMKYAESEIARKNVDNEGKVLAQLNHLNFVPKLYLQASENDYTIIKTSIVKGNPLGKQKIDEQILGVLIELSKQHLNTDRIFATKRKSCFAHGDFCPWNMMLDSGKLYIYDWEMAGVYPLGYDLFTYIFQTSFLLSPTIKIEEIIKKNKELITNFFKLLEINDWGNYLLEFSDIKLKIESSKNNNRLVRPYYQLKIFLSNKSVAFN
ncbi:phosphotransferase [Lutibacter citreus]|uniref:phosphotransferase n=1 Tax=Lutibacter citreus TaxID=2138210 RepID=UPI000DBE2F5C|nr:phosphotransferase [Lutibacter citreus]